MSDCLEYYVRQIVNQLGVVNIRKQKYKVILSINNPLLLEIFQKIFSELRVSARIYEGYNDLVGLRKEVVDSGANLGIYVSDEGDNAALVDEKGNIIKDQAYSALNALIMLKSTKLHTLVAPVTSSSALEQVAMKCGANFIRSKTTQKHILDAYFKNEKKIGRKDIINAYLLTLDAISICIFTLNLMAASNLTLSTILMEIPKFYFYKKEIVCPWNMKGKVMRSIIEQNSAASMDLIEGVKLNYQDSWVLVLPDSDEPICRVFAESIKPKEAERVSAELVSIIEKITCNIKEE